MLRRWNSSSSPAPLWPLTSYITVRTYERHDHLRNQFSQRLVAARKRLRNCDARTGATGMIAVDNARLTYSQEFMPCQRRFRDLHYPPRNLHRREFDAETSFLFGGIVFPSIILFFFYYNFHERKQLCGYYNYKEIRLDLARSGLDRTTLIIDDSRRVIAVVLNANLVNNPRDLRR